MKDAEIKKLAEQVLRKDLNLQDLDRIEVRIDRDDPDEPALFIEAYMKSGVREIAKGLASSAHHMLSQRLLEAGEDRFPYFLFRYTDKDVLAKGSPEA